MKKGTIGYLIRPLERTIQRVKLDDYHGIYKWIAADCFDVCRLTQDGDYVYVDDEGLLKQQLRENFFQAATYPTPLAGNGLMMGTDDEGDSVDPKMTWEELKRTQFFKQATMLNSATALLSDFNYIEEIGEL